MRMLRGVGQGLFWLAGLARAHPLIALVTVLAAGAMFVWGHWDTLGPQFAALWAGIQQGAHQLFAWLQAQGQRVAEWFAALPARFLRYGAQMMQALALGFTQALHTVKQAILGAGERLMRWFPSPLDAHPRTRALLGINPPRLKETTPAPPRWDTRRPLTTPVAQPVLIPGDTVQITIHAAPGMTPQALAQAIRTELDQRERTKFARRASRFTDD
jgi:hypothetical protein